MLPQELLSTLTESERDVLDMVFEGFVNTIIADRLMVGLRTVELRRQNIMQKLQTPTHAHLIRFCCKAGMEKPSVQVVKAS